VFQLFSTNFSMPYCLWAAVHASASTSKTMHCQDSPELACSTKQVPVAPQQPLTALPLPLLWLLLSQLHSPLGMALLRLQYVLLVVQHTSACSSLRRVLMLS
jgi:hypothetical protein